MIRVGSSNYKTSICDYYDNGPGKPLCLTSFNADDALAFNFVFASVLLSWLSGLVAGVLLVLLTNNGM